MAAARVLSLALALLTLRTSVSQYIRYKEIDIDSLKCEKMEEVDPLHGCRLSVVNETEQQVSCTLVLKQKQEDESALSFRKFMLNTISFRILNAIPSDQHAYCASIASVHLQIRDNDITESHTEADLPPGFITFLNFFTDDSFAHFDFTQEIPVATVTLKPECQGLAREDLRADCVDKVFFLREIKRGTFKLDFNGDNFWSFVKRRFVETFGAELTQLSITKSDRLALLPLQFITRVLSPDLRMRQLTAAGFPLGEVDQPLVTMPTLQVLRLPGDGITRLSQATLQFVPELKELDLSVNELKELPQSLPEGLEVLNVAHNKLSALNTTLSASLVTLNISNNTIATLPEPLPAGLQALDASHNRVGRLPQGLPQGLRLLSVCHNLLRSLPDNLPPALRVLQVSHNQLQTLSPQLLVPLQQLQLLDASHNRLSAADDLWLSHQLRLLNVSHNALRRLRLLGPGNVSHIDASYNQIESWKVRSSLLTLVGNPRSPLGLKFIRGDSPTAIDLGDDMLLDCDPCSSDSEIAVQLKRWLEKQGNTSLDGARVVRPTHPVCADPQEAGHPLLDVEGVEDSSGCPGSPRYVAQSLLLLISLLAVIVAVGVLCYIRRYEITYVWHLMMMRRERVAAERRHPSSYKYDAFVSYSSADRAWVVGQMLPKLENAGGSSDEPPLRLCLHERDFPLGSFIADNIISSMKDSRSTVIVLSQAFVDSQWCRWELEVASNKVPHLVLLELERMNRSRLPRNLRYLMDTRTYIEWPTQPRAQHAKWKQLRSVLAAPKATADAAGANGNADADADADNGAPAASEQLQQNGCPNEHHM